MTTLSDPRYRFVRFLIESLIVALLYLITAWLGYFIVLPLGNFPAFWLASGVALAAVVVWGWRMSLSVLVVSFIFMLQTVSGANVVAIASAAAVGVTFQALVGSFVLQRLVGILPPLSIRFAIRSILLIALIAGLTPLIGLIISSFGYAPPIVSWLWWLSVCIGMLTVAPGLIVITRHWHRLRMVEPLTWLLGSFLIGVVLFTFVLTLNKEEQDFNVHLRKDSHEMARAIEDVIRENEGSLLAVRSLLSTSRPIDRSEFNNFVSPFLQHIFPLRNIAWAPRVLASDRTSFEQTLRTNELIDFLIFERDANGQRLPSKNRAEYFPITFFEPFTINNAILGFDIGSESNQLQTITHAIETGEPALLPQIDLVQATRNPNSFSIVSAVYLQGKRLDSIASRRENLLGLVYGSFQLKSLIEIAMTEINAHDIELYIFDVTDLPQLLVFYPSSSGAQTLPTGTEPTLTSLETGLYHSFPINIYGRDWKIVARPASGYVAEMRSSASWFGLFIGLASVILFLLYIDIRQQTEKNLRLSDSQYRLISENTADVIWIFDLETQRFIYVSPSVEKLRGYTSAEMKEQTVEQVFTPASLVKVRGLLERIDSSEAVYVDELEQLHKNGSLIQTEITSRYVLNESGKMQIVSVARDITARKQTEDTLRESEERFRAIFQNNQSIMLLIEPYSGKILDANPAALKFYGFSRDHIATMNINEINQMPPDEVAAERLRATKEERNYFVFPHRIANGETRIVEVRSGPIKVKDQTLLFSIINDITDRKLAEMRLHRLNRTYVLLSEVNETIVRVREPQMLFDAACNIAVKRGGFNMAWIGLLDPNTKQVIPTAYAGSGYLDKLHVVLFDSGRELINAALRTGEHIVVNDINGEPNLRQDALQLGYLSLAIFPLIVLGEVRGVLNLYAPDSAFFDEAELKLLDEMAADIAFALEFIEQEKVVRQTKELYQSLFDQSADAVFLLDLNGKHTQVNKRAAEMLGYTYDEMLGLSAKELSGEITETQNVLERLAQGEVFPPYERLFKKKNGEVFSVEPHVTLIRDHDGNPFRIQSIVRDITERKQAEKLIKEQSEQLSLLYEASQKLNRTLDLNQIYQEVCNFMAIIAPHDGLSISSFDSETNLITCRAFWLADKWLDVSSFPSIPLDEEGKGTQSIVIRSGRPLLITDYQAMVKTSKTSYYVDSETNDIVDEAPPDEEVTRSAMIVPLKADDKVIGAIQVLSYRLNAYTENQLKLLEALALHIASAEQNALLYAQVQKARDELEQRVIERTTDLSRANLELARAVRAKDEFLANMSHELRTPLNAILVLSEGLLEQFRGPLNERQQKSLRNIEVSGRHLLTLINDILDLSKMEAGRMELQREFVSAAEVCDSSVLFVKEMMLKKQLDFVLQVKDPSAQVDADPKRLKQMLVNLLSNAVKFTEPNGKVSLEVNTDAELGVVHFAVRDTGIGIPPEDVTRLFQPFMQLDSKLSRQHEGTGLGLALVRRLAELHGGSIAIESEVGKGSCFTISLPYHSSGSGEAKSRVAPLPLPKAGVARLHSALIVEDSESAAEQLARYLQEINILTHVHSQSNGVVAQVIRLQPDVIFLDLQMPIHSGWEVLTELKSDPQTKNIPVIIVSVVDERGKGLAAGAAEYVVKPISREILWQTLEAITVAQDTPREARIVTEPSSVRAHILLAEDNEINILGISDYLQDKGYHLVVARTGREALDLAEEAHPDLILMDIQMPEMDGLEATRHLRERPQFATTPIIALTALAMPGDRERCLSAGANEYLTKPVSLKGLVEKIEELLKR